MLNYINYIKENKTMEYQITCEINEKYLIEISGQKNIIEALNNELNYIKTINIKKINKIENNLYLLTVNIDKDILDETKENTIEKAIYKEFSWLDQSGILIKNVNVI